MAYSIEIDFEVFKALTALRKSEADDYNDVLRRVLSVSANERPLPEPQLGGCWYSDVYFPEGTQFRATYKGSAYLGEIKGGVWIDSAGDERNSPSEAASQITGTNVNGWRFWHAKRPSDSKWIPLDRIRHSPQWDDCRALFQ